jgi:voltage-gated potassium channel Kch
MKPSAAIPWSVRRAEYLKLLPSFVGASVVYGAVLSLLKSGLFPLGSADRATIGVTVLVIASTAGYIRMARQISRSLVIREDDLPHAVLAYAGLAGLLISQCALFGWLPYDLVLATDAARHSGALSLIDGMYFSAATFTTLGYGDFVPAAGPGRCLAMYEALLGSALSVFFILIFLKGGAPTAGDDRIGMRQLPK